MGHVIVRLPILEKDPHRLGLHRFERLIVQQLEHRVQVRQLANQAELAHQVLLCASDLDETLADLVAELRQVLARELPDVRLGTAEHHLLAGHRAYRSALPTGGTVTFEVGDKVIYPNHGLGIVTRIEEKTILGTTCGFYHLRIVANETTVLVPVGATRTIEFTALEFDLLLHFAQTHIWYGALAEDVSIWSSQVSVIIMLVLILLMENQRRGLFFGRKAPISRSTMAMPSGKRLSQISSAVGWAMAFTQPIRQASVYAESPREHRQSKRHSKPRRST